MRTELELILESYLAAKAQTYAGNPTAAFIRAEVPTGIEAAAGKTGVNLLFEGSAGKGRWTDSPWIVVMDPLVTTTPQRGYYVVYLFAASMQRIVLSLNQGITDLRDSLPSGEAKETLRHSSELIRLTIPEYKQRFSAAGINLDAASGSSRSAHYEAGHAFGATYTFPLPSEEKLIDDLHEMLRLYRLVTFRGGPTEADEADEESPQSGIEDLRRFRFHVRIERNRKLAAAAKRVHGYSCQACDFTFERIYGAIGREYIEAHHLVPIHTLPKDQAVALDPKLDFAVLCGNCHRMIHRNGAPSTLLEFRHMLSSGTIAAHTYAKSTVS